MCQVLLLNSTDMEELKWKSVCPPSRVQEKASYKGLCLCVHDEGTWWVCVERNGAVLYQIADHHTHGGMGKNKKEAINLAVSAADEYLSKYPHL